MLDNFYNNIIIYYYIIVNLIGFFLMGIDKRKAVRRKWRIPEKTLFIFMLIGGFIGSFLGMLFFHHKTKKKIFYVVAAFSCALHIILWIYIL